MLEIEKVKEISGTSELPINPDYFLLCLIITLISKRTAHLSGLERTPLINYYENLLSDYISITQDESGFILSAKLNVQQPIISLPYTHLPFHDFIVFSLLGFNKSLIMEQLPYPQIERWQNIAASFACKIEHVTHAQNIRLNLVSADTIISPTPSLDSNLLHCYIGLALGLKKKSEITINFPFQSPLRYILPAFGYKISINSKGVPKVDNKLVKRLHLKLKPSAKDGEKSRCYIISCDFSQLNNNSVVSLNIPGDDILASIFIAAKSLIPKGQFFLKNVPLEPWNSPVLNFIRKMGAKIGMQTTLETSFGSSGIISFQKFKLQGRKIDCKPLFFYERQFPAIIVLSLFAKGQSVFKSLAEFRIESPMFMSHLLICMQRLGGRYGEMPDGLITDGAQVHDGFDLTEKMSANISGAWAIAAMKCTGKSTIEDTSILQRWPLFPKMIQNIAKQ